MRSMLTVNEQMPSIRIARSVVSHGPRRFMQLPTRRSERESIESGSGQTNLTFGRIRRPGISVYRLRRSRTSCRAAFATSVKALNGCASTTAMSHPEFAACSATRATRGLDSSRTIRHDYGLRSATSNRNKKPDIFEATYEPVGEPTDEAP